MAGKRLATEDFMVVLTGAGISAESGIPTFRSNGGLWRTHRYQDLATPEAFARDPGLVWEFYRWRQDGVRRALPNPAHTALKRFEDRLGEQRFVLLSQNVDDLHERAGSRDVWHMHGEIMKARCQRCGVILSRFDYQLSASPCPQCHAKGALRPHIVWFGETPLFLDEIRDFLDRATLFLAIGSSGTVFPAAQFVQQARAGGALTVLINLDQSDNAGSFQHVITGPAGVTMERIWREGQEDLFGYFRKLAGQ